MLQLCNLEEEEEAFTKQIYFFFCFTLIYMGVFCCPGKTSTLSLALRNWDCFYIKKQNINQ